MVLRSQRRLASSSSVASGTRRVVLKRKIGYKTEEEPDVQMEQEEDEEEDRLHKKTRWCNTETPSDGRSPSSEQLNQLEKMNLDS